MQRNPLAAKAIRLSYTHYQLAEYLAALLREAADAGRVSYTIFKRKPAPRRLADFIAKVATASEDALWSLAIDDMLEEELCKLGTSKESERVSRYRPRDTTGTNDSSTSLMINRKPLYELTRRAYLRKSRWRYYGREQMSPSLTEWQV
ncbi:unnamed protein product [Sympodiomycopsis kandeliae]